MNFGFSGTIDGTVNRVTTATVDLRANSNQKRALHSMNGSQEDFKGVIQSIKKSYQLGGATTLSLVTPNASQTPKKLRTPAELLTAPNFERLNATPKLGKYRQLRLNTQLEQAIQLTN